MQIRIAEFSAIDYFGEKLDIHFVPSDPPKSNVINLYILIFYVNGTSFVFSFVRERNNFQRKEWNWIELMKLVSWHFIQEEEEEERRAARECRVILTQLTNADRSNYYWCDMAQTWLTTFHVNPNTLIQFNIFQVNSRN